MTARYGSYLIVAVIAGAFLLRVWGIDFGLPYIYHPDEHRNLGLVLKMLAKDNPNPGFFHYPSLFLYLNALTLMPYLWVARALELVPNTEPVAAAKMIAVGTGITSLPSVFVVARLVSAVCGVGTVVLTYAAARRLFKRMPVAVLAAVCVAVSPTLVEQSRFATPDIVATFFTSVAIWGAARVLTLARLRDSVIAGVGIGLAASSKYNVALVACPVLVAHLLSGAGGLRRVVVAALAAVAAFAVTSPFTIIDHQTFFKHLSHQATHYAEGHPGMEGDAFAFYVESVLVEGGPALFLAGVGVAFGIALRSRAVGVLVSFAVTYLWFISSLEVRNERTLLPLLPGLFLLSAHGLSEGTRVLNTRGVPRLGAIWLSRGIAILMVGWLGFRSIAAGIRNTTPDSRETARVWIEQNLPVRSRIAIEAYSPYVNPRRFKVKRTFFLIERSAGEYARHFDYVVSSEGGYPRFLEDPKRYQEEIQKYKELFQSFKLLKSFNDGGYSVNIYEPRPLS